MKIDEGKKKIISLLLVIAINLLCLGAGYYFLVMCDLSGEQKENTIEIGMSYMTMNNEFYSIVSQEIIARIEAEGDRYVIRDPGLNEERQEEQIREMVEHGIDVLVVTPVNSETICPLLRELKEQGIIIIVVDSDAEETGLADCTITSDNYTAGRNVGAYYALTHQKAKLVLMIQSTAMSGVERVRGFKTAIENTPGIEIVAEIECEGQTEIAMPKMQEVLESGLEFDDVFCLNDLAAVGVVAALEEKGLLDQVGVYGVDASPDAKALIYENMMVATAAQYPTKIGSKTADAIYQILEGEKTDSYIRVPTTLVTGDNVLELGIDRWQ